MGVEKSYTEATLVMVGDERIPVVMAAPDRIRTQRKFGMNQSQAIQKGKGEEWVAHAFYLSWKRETGRSEEFEVFLETFIGYETESEEDEDTEPSGEAPTPA